MTTDDRSTNVVEVIPPEKVEIIQPAAQTPATQRTALLPALGAVLLWTGREILPRLADTAFSFLDRRAPTSPAAGESPAWRDAPRSPAPRGRGRMGRRARRRQRGGRGRGRGRW